MTRFLLKVVAVLTILFAACIALIHAQPYDDTELRAFFAPPGNCPHPCFVGIRPGITTVEEAMAILEAHEWIASVDRYPLTAIWNGAQPPWLQGAGEFRLIDDGDIIQRVFVPTSIRLGDIWLALGPPSRLFRLESLDNLGSFNVAYPFGMIGFTVSGSCSMRSVWESRAFLDFDTERAVAHGLEGKKMLRDVVERCHRLRAIISR